jgi:hypothetical protein
MPRPPSGVRPERRARRARAGAAALGLVAAAAAAAGAQAPTGEAPLAFDVGLARIEQAGTAPLLAPSVGASWRARGARGGGGVAAVAAAGDGRVASQLALDAARAFGPARLPREVTADARGVRVPNTPWAAQLLAGVRQHALWAGGGAWAGAQGGVVRQVGETWPSAAAEAGAWWRAGPGGRVALTAAAATARVAERGLVAAGLDAYAPARVRTGDLVASYARAAGRVEVGAWLGARAYGPGGLRALPADDEESTRPGAPLRWRAVAAASATAWVAPALGLTASAGVLPNDPVRGVPAARHVVMAVRMRPWARGGAGAARPAAGGPRLLVADVDDAPAGAPAAGGPAADGDGGPAAERPRRAVRVVAPGARRVRLRADATGWHAVELARATGEPGRRGCRSGRGRTACWCGWTTVRGGRRPTSRRSTTSWAGRWGCSSCPDAFPRGAGRGGPREGPGRRGPRG